MCAICGRRDPEHVDHDHDTKQVRGILCFNCNGGLGQFKENVESLLRAVDYLETTTVPRNAGWELDETVKERALRLHESAA